MRFASTRGNAPAVPFSEALARGLAPDGGLYVPERFPEFNRKELASWRAGEDARGVAEFAARMLDPWIEGDGLHAGLAGLCGRAFDFEIPCRALDERSSVLELFHGPSCAFKDVGARFLAECMSALPAAGPRTVLVATSGDTGGAVAAAFHGREGNGREGMRVAILYPMGGVSPVQEHQLTCWRGNVRAYAVRGTFDDCQRLAKQAFTDAELTARHGLTSANSINLGRLLPQAVYYAGSSLAAFRRTGRSPGFIVPTGNLGNAVAAFWAMRMGFPIREVALATNANRPVPDYLETGKWKPRPSLSTLANAMDVGDPSNMERLRHLYPDLAALKAVARARSVSDEEIRAQIRADFTGRHRVWCPHTATAARLLGALRAEGDRSDWILVATAHPAKFPETVEPLIGTKVPPPPALAKLLALPGESRELGASLADLSRALGEEWR